MAAADAELFNPYLRLRTQLMFHIKQTDRSRPSSGEIAFTLHSPLFIPKFTDLRKMVTGYLYRAVQLNSSP